LKKQTHGSIFCLALRYYQLLKSTALLERNSIVLLKYFLETAFHNKFPHVQTLKDLLTNQKNNLKIKNGFSFLFLNNENPYFSTAFRSFNGREDIICQPIDSFF